MAQEDFTPEQIELHHRVLKQIEAEPERWRQAAWVSSPGLNNFDPDGKCRCDLCEGFRMENTVVAQACDTAFCYAGWALAITNPDYRFGTTSAYLDGECVGEVKSLARDLLGLDWDQANELFESSNSLEDIKTHLVDYGIINPE